MRHTLVIDSDGKSRCIGVHSAHPKHFPVIGNQERWIERRVGPVITRVVKGRSISQRLFQLSIDHRRKLHVVFPCVTRRAGYNRVTLLLRYQDHYQQLCSRKHPFKPILAFIHEIFFVYTIILIYKIYKSISMVI